MVSLVSAARWRLFPGAVCARVRALFHVLALAFLSAILGAGCGAKVKPPIFEEDDPRAGRTEATEPDAPVLPTVAETAEPDAGPGRTDDAGAAAPAEPPPALVRPRPIAPPGAHPRAGSIDRLALLRVLDAGPGGLLRTVEVSPFFEGSRFLGWRLDQIVDAASPLAAVDLAAGDIILAVNRRPIARPEHVMAIWQELRAADELVCQVWRGAAAFELRFAITPRATPQQAAPPPPPLRPAAAQAAAPPPRR